VTCRQCGNTLPSSELVFRTGVSGDETGVCLFCLAIRIRNARRIFHQGEGNNTQILARVMNALDGDEKHQH